MKQSTKVLDGRIRNFLERYELALSEAVDGVSERFAEKIEPLVEEFGGSSGRYRSQVLRCHRQCALQEAFGPAVADSWEDE
jgi:hypothetical protein